MPVRSARLVTCAVALLFASSALAAETPPRKATPKVAAKTVKPPGRQARSATVKAEPRTLKKAALKSRAEPAAKPAPALRGPTETLACRDGTEDRHARIGVVLIGGKVDSFAYYSKWKPRTCSVYLQRNRDGYSKWTDKGNVTSVGLERGSFTIEHHKGEYRFVFRDVDRERYCGMDGTINGTLTIRKGSERCELAGVMEEGVPLGQAYAHIEQPQGAPAAVFGYSTATAAPPRPQTQTAQQSRSQSEHAWPAPTPGLSD